MTKYSRETRNKNQLRQNMNTPRYGVNACSLCERGRLPDDLNFKVGKYKTCADVHLELSLLKPDQATCVAGQAQYRDMCCDSRKSFSDFLPKLNMKPPMAVVSGLFLFWVFTKRIKRRVQPYGEEPDDETDEYYQMEDEEQDSRKSRQSKGKKKELEIVSKYKKGPSNSQGRSKSRERGSRRESVATAKAQNKKRSKSRQKKRASASGPASLPSHVRPEMHLPDEYHLDMADPQQYQNEHLPYYPPNHQDDLPYYPEEAPMDPSYYHGDQDPVYYSEEYTNGPAYEEHHDPEVYYEIEDGPVTYGHPDEYYQEYDNHAGMEYQEDNNGTYELHYEDQSTLMTSTLGGFEEPDTGRRKSRAGEESVQAVMTQVV